MHALGKNLKALFVKYKYLLLLLYFPVYLVWFGYVEKTVTTDFHVIYMKIDDYIPFYEVFIIPYLLWFAYIGVVVVYIALTSESDFKKMCIVLYTGMTVFLIVSTVYPNGHLLRPTTFPRDNIFTQIIARLYETDTPTNIFPSIHVYNSVSAHFAIIYNEKLRKKKWICIGSTILMVSIVMSTVLLKQHSVFDIITALALVLLMQQLVYVRVWEKFPRTAVQKFNTPHM